MKNTPWFQQTLIDVVPAPIFYKDANCVYIGGNKAFEQYLGLPSEQFVGKTVYDIAPADLAAIYDKADKELLNNPGVQTYEASVVYADGTRHEVIFNKTTFNDAEGNVAGLIGVIQDITGRKRAEESLRLSHDELEKRVEERTRELRQANKSLQEGSDERKKAETELQKGEQIYRTIINNIRDTFYRTDKTGLLIMVSPSGASMFGYDTLEEIVGKLTAASFYKDPSERERLMEKMKKDGFVKDHELTLCRKDGSTIPISLSSTSYTDSNGEFAGFEGFIRDISERKHAEERVRQSEAKYRNLFESSTDGIFIVDLNGNFIDMNTTAYTRLGYTKEEMLALHISKLDHPEFAPRVPEWMAKIREHGSAMFESAHMRKDGTSMPVEVNTRMIEHEGRTVYFSVIRDITERKKASDLILCSLKEKEVLLKEVHHRVKNNMQVVYSLLNLQAKGITDKTTRAILEDARNRVHSMVLIHEKLYGSVDLAHVDFKEYLQGLVAGIGNTYKRRDIVLSVDMEPIALGVNVGIPCGLIANELVSNCMKYAFPEGRKGMIKVGLSRNSEGNNVLIVADNGVGFPDSVDFRNTASLGLQLVNVLTGQIQGKVDLLQAEGTTFRITFPGTTEHI